MNEYYFYFYSKIYNMPSFIQNTSQDNKRVDMLMFGVIGVDFSGDDFAKSIADAVANGAKSINIYINSNGGSILEGHSIITAMILAREHGVSISTINSGVADSMASIVLAFGDKGKRKMFEFATSLFHEPLVQINGNRVRIDEVEDQNLKEELISKKRGLVNILSSSMDISSEDISSFMEAETTFTAKEAKKIGLVDEVLSVSNNTDSISSINLKDRGLLMVACSELGIIKQNDNMDLKIYEKLSVAESDGVEGILNAIDKLKVLAESANENAAQQQDDENDGASEELTALKEKLESLEKEKKELEDKLHDSIDREAETVVNQAISAGKYTAESKPELLAQAKKDLAAFRVLTSAIKAHRVNVVDMLNSTTEDPAKDYATEYAKLYKYDPKALSELEKSSPAKYDRMFKAYMASTINIDKF